MPIIEPWQYKVPKEVLEQQDPNLQALTGISKALSAGQQAYQTAQLGQYDLETHRQAIAPKQVFGLNKTTQSIEPIGQPVPQAAVIQDITPPPAKEGEYYKLNEAGELETTGVKTGTAENKIQGKSLDPAKQPMSDEQVEKTVEAIISGKMSPKDIQSFRMNRQGVGSVNWQKINAKMQEKGWNEAEWEMHYKYESDPAVMNMRGTIENARMDATELERINKMYKRSGIQSFNKFLTTVKDEFGQPIISRYKAAQVGFVDSVANALGPARASATDARLELAAKLVKPAETAEQINATIEETRRFLDNREKSIDMMGTKGYFELLRKEKKEQDKILGMSATTSEVGVKVTKTSDGKFRVEIP